MISIYTDATVSKKQTAKYNCFTNTVALDSLDSPPSGDHCTKHGETGMPHRPARWFPFEPTSL